VIGRSMKPCRILQFTSILQGTNLLTALRFNSGWRASRATTEEARSSIRFGAQSRLATGGASNAVQAPKLQTYH
jgi:hypothetical protein